MNEEVTEVVEEVPELPENSIDLTPITESNDKIIEKLDEVVQLLTPGEVEDVPAVDPVEYTDQLAQLTDLVQQQNDMLVSINDANNTILVYGLIIAPLFLLCMCLWWFFKQFLYRF